MGAYQTAIDRIESPITRSVLRQFMQDHERHTRELTPVILELGGTPPTSGDLKGVLTKGKVVIGQIAGDVGILAAMHSIEDDTITAFERAVDRIDLSEHTRAILHQGLEDERRHRGWIANEIGRTQHLRNNAPLVRDNWADESGPTIPGYMRSTI